MGSILPVASTRTSELLIQQRLLAQLGDDQTGLLKLETQINSGQRLTLPSDDAPAALRAISLQQLINRKNQASSNITTNQSFLSASDAALSRVSSLLINVRGNAQSVVGTLATDAQRSATADQVHQALQQLINSANQQFNGRYLFAGSRNNIAPFGNNGVAVQYNGNQNALSSFGDTALLFQTNSDGDSVFGAISSVVQGTTDLNPALTNQTRLDDLHGGNGIAKGRFAISDGTSTSIIDISNASTVGDVIGQIERNPPSGRTVTAELTSTGLNISLDAAGGGSLTIKEIGGGTTASSLGILRNTGQGVGPIVGKDLNPQLTDTTPLANLLGSQASTMIVSPGAGNDIVISARDNGPQFNGVGVSFVNNPSIPPGQETVSYDANARTLVFQVNAGHSTTQNVVDALNNDPQVGALFQAQLGANDVGSPLNPLSTFVDVTASGTTAGGSGTSFDQKSGLRITSGGQTFTIDISQSSTVQDLLNRINGTGAGALAEINSAGTGINIRSRLSGVDFSIGENGGATATQLGIRSFTAATRLEDLNHGNGVHTLGGNGPDFIVRRKDGIELKVDVSQAKTIGDVIDLVNNNPANQDSNHSVTARLAALGNGIEFVTSDAANVAPLAILKGGTSQAAQDLGLIPAGASSSQPSVVAGGIETLTGQDIDPGEVNGAFTALVRLEQALRADDDVGIGRALDLLNDSSTRINLARADLGSRQQALDTLQSGLGTEVTTLKDSLSKEVDTDLPTAISDLTSRQAAFQAALQTTAVISKLTLLNYL